MVSNTCHISPFHGETKGLTKITCSVSQKIPQGQTILRVGTMELSQLFRLTPQLKAIPPTLRQRVCPAQCVVMITNWDNPIVVMEAMSWAGPFNAASVQMSPRTTAFRVLQNWARNISQFSQSGSPLGSRPVCIPSASLVCLFGPTSNVGPQNPFQGEELFWWDENFMDHSNSTKYPDSHSWARPLTPN